GEKGAHDMPGVHARRRTLIAAAVDLADQRVALPLGIDELDREAVLGVADDPCLDVADILQPQPHDIALPAGRGRLDARAGDRDIAERRGETAIPGRHAHAFPGGDALLAAVAREFDAHRP